MHRRRRRRLLGLAAARTPAPPPSQNAALAEFRAQGRPRHPGHARACRPSGVYRYRATGSESAGSGVLSASRPLPAEAVYIITPRRPAATTRTSASPRSTSRRPTSRWASAAPARRGAAPRSCSSASAPTTATTSSPRPSTTPSELTVGKTWGGAYRLGELKVDYTGKVTGTGHGPARRQERPRVRDPHRQHVHRRRPRARRTDVVALVAGALAPGRPGRSTRRPAATPSSRSAPTWRWSAAPRSADPPPGPAVRPARAARGGHLRAFATTSSGLLGDRPAVGGRGSGVPSASCATTEIPATLWRAETPGQPPEGPAAHDVQTGRGTAGWRTTGVRAAAASSRRRTGVL